MVYLCFNISLMNILSLIIGGTAGTLARYFLNHIIYHFFRTSFPYGTLTVNLTGCFILGILASLSSETLFLTYNQRLLLVTGFCGAFTTFSTFIFETDHLIRNGEALKAILNVLLSIVLGYVFFKVGGLLGKAL